MGARPGLVPVTMATKGEGGKEEEFYGDAGEDEVVGKVPQPPEPTPEIKLQK